MPFVEELQNARSLKFQPLFWGMFFTLTFQNLVLDIWIEINMFFTFAIVVAE